MTNPPHDALVQPDLDLDRALAELRRAFPGICIWFGEFSGSLWALLPDRLVEARNADGLARRLRAALGPPSVPASPTRRPDGTWCAPRRGNIRPPRGRGRKPFLAHLFAALVPRTGRRVQ
ncbi:hypothetical protein BJF79_39140 [Actinomadura sp. CNU-125]|uniref:hypothetical protein n=1 Tax=Actinomadura sp. CNU-125 TaxID=1904961 RepID=UPI00095E8AD9|nr:hypothetical protein [Actinomadura sp. CNU-125]OLT30287.1 hypothetical protein BJF79_39140 [Actinomadura sp. CNU-125]